MKRIALGVSICCLVAFTFLSKFEDRPQLRNLDFAVTVKIQERIDRSAHLRLASLVGNIMEGSTFFASPAFTSVVVIVLAVGMAYDRKKKRFYPMAMVIPIGFGLILLAELYGKSIVHHPSPPFSMIKHPTSLFPANYVNEQFSYPSGHAARALFIGIIGVLLYLKSTLTKENGKSRVYKMVPIILAVVYVLLVSISRIYLGEHWFSDVLGGLLLGSGIGCLSLLFLV